MTRSILSPFLVVLALALTAVAVIVANTRREPEHVETIDATPAASTGVAASAKAQRAEREAPSRSMAPVRAPRAPEAADAPEPTRERARAAVTAAWLGAYRRVARDEVEYQRLVAARQVRLQERQALVDELTPDTIDTLDDRLDALSASVAAAATDERAILGDDRADQLDRLLEAEFEAMMRQGVFDYAKEYINPPQRAPSNPDLRP